MPPDLTGIGSRYLSWLNYHGLANDNDWTKNVHDSLSSAYWVHGWPAHYHGILPSSLLPPLPKLAFSDIFEFPGSSGQPWPLMHPQHSPCSLSCRWVLRGLFLHCTVSSPKAGPDFLPPVPPPASTTGPGHRVGHHFNKHVLKPQGDFSS